MTFGKNLQALRKEKGLSQDALANQLYVTRQSVSQWENDKTMPSVDLLLKLSEIYDTTVDALLGKPQSDQKPQPLASAGILHSKKEIFTAMRFEFATAVIVLLSVGVLFTGIWLMLLYLERNLHTPEVTKLLIKDYLNLWELLTAAGLCFAAAVVLGALRLHRTMKAIRFSESHSCTLQFYHDGLVIEETETEPLRLFYANLLHVTETDAYFILQMQNHVRMCVRKSDLENISEISMLLKAAKTFLDRRLNRNNLPVSKTKRAVTRFLINFFFVATFFTPAFFTVNYQLLCTVLADSHPWRLLVFSLPFALLTIAIVIGIVLLARGFRAKRMIIAGGVGLIAVITLTVLTNCSLTLYNFQHNRVTSEEFVSYMEAHNMEVSDTIKGRQENFITKCYTARPKDKHFEVLYMEFDPYSKGYGIHAASEAYGKLANEAQSQPRQWTQSREEALGFNAFYTSLTNNYYTYASLNEYSVIYINTTPERQQEVKEVLRDCELPHPY
ncbi:MAG: helix-turn-helix transcriptional regulator [Ruminococcus sp.]|nr:helix-turn-helix transcriptional regulator [Ruminococcus sp.]